MILGLAVLPIEDLVGRGVSALGVMAMVVPLVVSALDRIWSSLAFLDSVVASPLDSFLEPRRLYRLLKFLLSSLEKLLMRLLFSFNVAALKRDHPWNRSIFPPLPYVLLPPYKPPNMPFVAATGFFSASQAISHLTT